MISLKNIFTKKLNITILSHLQVIKKFKNRVFEFNINKLMKKKILFRNASCEIVSF